MTHVDRRGVFAREYVIAFGNGRLTASADGTVRRALDIADIAEIRLCVEPAGRGVQVTARVRAAGGDAIVFGSRAWRGLGEWDNRTESFRAVLADLHEGLRPRWEAVRFLEGPPPRLSAALTAGGLALAGAGISFAVWMLAEHGQAIGLIALAPAAAGAWLALLYRPRAPKPYEPEAHVRSQPPGGAT